MYWIQHNLYHKLFTTIYSEKLNQIKSNLLFYRILRKDADAYNLYS